MDVNNQKTTEHEYEIQFFGFTPDSFVNGGKLKETKQSLSKRGSNRRIVTQKTWLGLFSSSKDFLNCKLLNPQFIMLLTTM